LKLRLIGLVLGLWCFLGGVQATEFAAYKILKLEGNNVRWERGTGAHPVIRYSVANAPVEFSGARNCRKITAMNDLLGTSGIPSKVFRNELAAAFAMWEAAANISFREASSPAEADILIGAQLEPEGWAFADVFYNAFSVGVMKPISKALICLNPTRAWKVGFDGDLGTYDLRYTLAHEIGHAIGLDHPSGGGQIMGYRYEERFRELQPGDIAGAVQLYGEHRADGQEVAATPGDDTKRHVSATPHVEKRGGTRAFTARSH